MDAGFKNFRPVRLVLATRLSNGALVGGRLITPRNSEIPGFSTEQDFGTNPNPASWRAGKFVVSGTEVQHYDFVRTRLASRELSLVPS